MLTDDGVALSQFMAIIEYLDETHPAPPCCPPSRWPGPRCGRPRGWRHAPTHQVLNYLVQTLKADEAKKNAWYSHWPAAGWRALERRWCRWRSGAAQGSGTVQALRAFHRWPTVAWCRMCSIASVNVLCAFAARPRSPLRSRMALLALQVQLSACPDHQP